MQKNHETLWDVLAFTGLELEISQSFMLFSIRSCGQKGWFQITDGQSYFIENVYNILAC